jgi:hypothetical protein
VKWMTIRRRQRKPMPMHKSVMIQSIQIKYQIGDVIVIVGECDISFSHLSLVHQIFA